MYQSGLKCFPTCVLRGVICTYVMCMSRHALMDQIGFTYTDSKQNDGSRWVVNRYHENRLTIVSANDGVKADDDDNNNDRPAR